MMPWLIALVIGAGVVMALWGCRGWFMGRYERDVAWVRETALRFTPEAVRAERWVWGMYGGFLVLLLVFLFITQASPIFGVGLWVVSLFLPRILVEVMWQRRRREIDQQLPGAIASMCNSIKAGLTLVQAIERLGERAPDPIRTEFKVMANHYAYGADLVSTIKEAKARLNLPNFNLFASAVLLNREMGGDVSETLFRISKSLDKLREMRKTVEAHTSEGRTNIKVLTVAPVVMLLILATVDPEGVKQLFTTSEGYTVLMIAGIMTGTGVYFAAKIVKTEL